MINKVNMFLNILAIAFALLEIVVVILGVAPSAFCFGVAWFCVICWVVNSWINEYSLEKKDAELKKKDAELAQCEEWLEDAMKTIDTLREN